MKKFKSNRHIKKVLKSKKSKRWLAFSVLGSLVSILLVLAGLYVLLLTQAPKIAGTLPLIGYSPPSIRYDSVGENRLYIPQIEVNIGFLPGDEKVLNEHAWHRFPERGNPEDGGNFILAAHRFQLGFLPGETKRRSPFYNLNKLNPGEPIYLDYNGKRYKYEVTRRYSVKPTDSFIEAPSEEAKLTLYTCTLRGQSDGREVVEATLVDPDFDVQTLIEGDRS